MVSTRRSSGGSTAPSTSTTSTPSAEPVGGLEGFRALSEASRFEGPLFSVATLRLADPDGHEFSRDVVRHPGAVSVIPLHDDGSVTLVRQLRVAVGEAVGGLGIGLQAKEIHDIDEA